MHYTAASILAFASAVLAQTANFDVISKPTEGSVVPAGETYTITWSPTADYNNDTITLTLLGGATSKTLQTVSVIKAGVANSAGEYAWAVASSLGAEATYGIEITLDSDPSILEYSFPFTISGGGASSSSGSGSASGSTTGSSSASSSAPASTTKTTSSSSSSSSSVKTTSTTSSSSSSSSPAAPSTLTTVTSAAGNGTVTTTKPSGSKTVVTATHTATKSGSAASGTASTVTTSGAKSLGAGSFVTLMGGLAVAFFAL